MSISSVSDATSRICGHLTAVLCGVHAIIKTFKHRKRKLTASFRNKKQNPANKILYKCLHRDVYDDVMSEETAPEIQRTNLAKVVLYLKTMAVHDVIR